MCVDFIDLNKCCPKDPYPLPRIDKLVDIVAGCEVMSLLDFFYGYHQIWLNPDDEEKQVSSPQEELIVTGECLRDYETQDLLFIEWRTVFLTNRKAKISSRLSTTSWSRAIRRRPIFRTFRKHSKT